MADYKRCWFYVLRYQSNPVSGEPVNIGVVLLEEGEQGFSGVRFRRDWGMVRAHDPDVDLELLQSYEEELTRLLNSRTAEVINYKGAISRRDWLLEQMEQSFSGAIELAPRQAVLTESPSAELGILAHAYLEAPARAPRVQTGRRAIYQAMRAAFESAGVWPFLRLDIPVAQYTRPGDPLKIDCGYRPNGVIHLFHALSLATDVNSAKVLSFTYAQMRDGIIAKEHAMSDLTVVTEGATDPYNEGVAYALATLQENEITISTVADMPQIAERARLDLKL